jgi:antitoxin component YwqK of YwqJK toxin-antitoxin module
MRKLFLSFLILFFCGSSFAQTNQERILYIVDKIPVINPTEDDEEILNEDIDNLEIITDSVKIKTLGYANKIDKIILVTTKAYLTRSAEDKLIPTTKVMVRKNGLWFEQNADTPYTGAFIDYFMNGKKQGEGMLKAGLIDGVRTVYYPNGNKRYFYTYTKGIENGPSEEYFTNGKLKQKGSFINEKETGLWQVFYSTGKIKRQSSFVNNKQDTPKEGVQFYTMLDKAIALMKDEDYKSAIKKLNDAEKLNPGYSDLYFYRGTAKLDNFDFDNAIIDLDKAIEIEPLYMEAISNRAFARLRKYEFKDSRTLTKNSEVTILAAKDKVNIPKDDLDKICADLKLGYDLGDHKQMIVDAITRYCK